MVVDRLAPLAALDGLRDEVEVVDVGKIPRGRFTPAGDDQRPAGRARPGRARPSYGSRAVTRSSSAAAARRSTPAWRPASPVEVVPGVTSAIAVPGLVGVPATHRGLSQGFTVVSGHAAPGDPAQPAGLGRAGPVRHDAGPADGGRHVARDRGGAARRRAGARHAGRCRPGRGLPRQRVVTATLETAAAVVAAEGLRPPAVVVIGAVAGLAAAGESGAQSVAQSRAGRYGWPMSSGGWTWRYEDADGKHRPRRRRLRVPVPVRCRVVAGRGVEAVCWRPASTRSTCWRTARRSTAR